MIRIVLLSLLVSYSHITFGTELQHLKRILATPTYEHINKSIVITSGKKNKTLININGNKQMIPASLMKIILTATCFKEISTHFRYRTPVYIDKQSPPNIYIKGVGDPNLTLTQFKKIAQTLKNKNISTIGHIILDDTYVEPDKNLYGTSTKYYYALSGALNSNFNQIELTYNEVDNSFIFIPESSYSQLSIKNSAYKKTTKRRLYPTLRLFQQPTYDLYNITGDISLSDLISSNFTLRISQPSHFVAQLIEETLKKSSINILNSYRIETFSKKKKRLLLQLVSPKIKNYLETLNKDSNNMIASSLAKTLGVLKYGKPGTSQQGYHVMEDFLLNQLHTKDKNFLIDDSSGLSIKNKLSANQIIKILTISKKKYHRKFYETLVNVKTSKDYHSLTIPTHIDVYVKSGTLGYHGVTNLAGILINRETNNYAQFVFMCEAPINKIPIQKGELTKPLLQQFINDFI